MFLHPRQSRFRVRLPRINHVHLVFTITHFAQILDSIIVLVTVNVVYLLFRKTAFANSPDSTAADEPFNTIIIYDLEGKKLAHNVRLSISDQEPENISLVDGVFYIGCNPKSGSTKLDIYKTVLYEFDFDAVKPLT